MVEQWIKMRSLRSTRRILIPAASRSAGSTAWNIKIRSAIWSAWILTRQDEFPPDDTGHGFDNIGDVLTLSPMLLEKYLVAAEKIIAQAVPVVARVVPEQVIPGAQFRAGARRRRAKATVPGRFHIIRRRLSPTRSKRRMRGQYQLDVDLMVNEKYVDDVFDYNKCRLIFRVDGKELLRKEFSWEGGKPYHYNYDQDWAAGNHQLDFELQPLTPGLEQGPDVVDADHFRDGARADGQGTLGAAKKLCAIFSERVPETAAGRRAYASELLGDFARRAFRRPVDNETTDRLAGLAESIYEQPGKTFEAGVAEAMVAVLASPRFIFREESVRARTADNLMRWWMNMRWPRGFRICCGRPCRTRNCSSRRRRERCGKISPPRSPGCWRTSVRRRW